MVQCAMSIGNQQYIKSKRSCLTACGINTKVSLQTTNY